MSQGGEFTFKGMRREIAALYSDSSLEMAQVRGAHLNAIVRQTPYAMAANFGSGLLVFWAFGSPASSALWLWWATLMAVSGLATLRWWSRRRNPPETASPRALRRATQHAAALAAAWAVLLLGWFPVAPPSMQLLILVLLTGMLSAGAFVLSALPLASLSYIAIFFAAALGALWLAGDPSFVMVGALLCVYAPMVAIGSLFSWRKATALLKSQAEAVRQERILAVVLEDFEQHAGDALWETDVDGRLSHVSQRLTEILGAEATTLRGQLLDELLRGGDPAGVEALKDALSQARPFRDLQLALQIDGEPRHLVVSAKPLLSDDARVQGWRGVVTDVTEKVKGINMLRQLAHHDSLTGLANRFTFRDALTESLSQNRGGALFIIDLDHFKTINDTLGHAAGDDVLKAVARRLTESVEPDDVVARLGGDEFAVLGFGAGMAEAAAGLAKKVIVALTAPVDVQGRQLRVGASVGVALCDDPQATVESLLIQADTALYAAKGAGRGRHAVYTPELGDLSRRRTKLESGLRHAVERNELSLHWQPKIEIDGWKLVGAEGLMRWNHPELGMIEPTEFIAIAEQCGMIEQLGDWALRAACKAAQTGLSGLTVAVNVSPLQLRDGRFLGKVRDALLEFDLDPAQLELEITESAFMDDADGALERMHALRGLGVRMALDDFGAGYSSLAYLRRFPFDTIKIDRAFIEEALHREDVRAIISMIARLAVTLKMRTVCEGVETTAQLAAVTQASCDEVQGFLFCKPQNLADFVKMRAEPMGMRH